MNMIIFYGPCCTDIDRPNQKRNWAHTHAWSPAHHRGSPIWRPHSMCTRGKGFWGREEGKGFRGTRRFALFPSRGGWPAPRADLGFSADSSSSSSARVCGRSARRLGVRPSHCVTPTFSRLRLSLLFSLSSLSLRGSSSIWGSGLEFILNSGRFPSLKINPGACAYRWGGFLVSESLRGSVRHEFFGTRASAHAGCDAPLCQRRRRGRVLVPIRIEKRGIRCEFGV
ncbi:hypothetical protein NL676_033269 [Syzygium grande]|nr:hypothetical protein NL676_033269 [Syzygium grande]